MKWKKRTQEEINYSTDKLKDYTGGYEFFPWLWFMRKLYLLGFFGNMALGWCGGMSGILNDPKDWVGYAIIGFFGVLAPALIGYMLRRDYKMLQKGQSS